MFNLQTLVPPYLMQNSRDFQLMVRLWQLWVSENRMQATTLASYSDPESVPDTWLELEAIKLGFRPRTQLEAQDLRALLRVYKELLNHKGTLQAVTALINSLVRSSEPNSPVQNLVFFDSESNSVVVQTESSLVSPSALREGLRQLLPVGVGLLFQQGTKQKSTRTSTSVSESIKGYKDEIQAISSVRAASPVVEEWQEANVQAGSLTSTPALARSSVVGAVGVTRVVGKDSLDGGSE